MTLVLGFKSRNSVFITGDSAITFEGDWQIMNNPDDKLVPTTSFYEKNVDEEQLKVREVTIKSIQINEKIIAGYAGLVFPALNVLKEFRKLLTDINDTAPDLIKETFRQAVTNNYSNEIQLIVGFVYNDTPHLISYNYRNSGEFGEHDTTVLIGSFKEEEEGALTTFIRHLQSHDIDEKSILSSINAILQSIGLREYILEKFGIGGAFMGIYTNSHGVFRQDNVMYIIYHDRTPQMWVDIIFNNHVANVRTINRYYKIFCDPLYYDEENDFLKVAAEMIKTDYIDSYKYLVFLSVRNGLIFVLLRNPMHDSRYFTLRFNNGNIEYSFHPKLEILFQEMEGTNFYFAFDEPENENRDKVFHISRL